MNMLHFWASISDEKYVSTDTLQISMGSYKKYALILRGFLGLAMLNEKLMQTSIKNHLRRFQIMSYKATSQF